MLTSVSNPDSKQMHSPHSNSNLDLLCECKAPVVLSQSMIRSVIHQYLIRTLTLAQLPHIPHLSGHFGIYYAAIWHFFHLVGFVSSRFFDIARQSVQYYFLYGNSTLLYSSDVSSVDFLSSSLIKMLSFFDATINPQEITLLSDCYHGSSLKHSLDHVSKVSESILPHTSQINFSKVSRLNFICKSITSTTNSPLQ
ncbi:hypothetical protein GEMRC1_001414 [Eukaryota sp. GEM-RC1]